MKLLLWKPKRSAPIRWFLAACIGLASFLIRFWGGIVHGANPALTFYPAILIVTLFVGWREAVAVLVALVALGVVFFMPHGMFLLPFAWAIIGGLNIAIIASLKSLAGQLNDAGERQRILFRELQHRVANTLHTVVGGVEVAGRRIDSAPAEAARLLDEIAQRLTASADVHRRLHDPTLFERGLESVLHDAVASVIDRRTVTLMFDIEPLDLTFDQMSGITMLVIEAANNAQKHVFERGRGSTFSVTLTSAPGRTARLTVRDDGPGQGDVALDRVGLGMSIITDLARQINGTLSVSSEGGRLVVVEFPTTR